MAGWMLDEAARVSEFQSHDRCPLWWVSALSGAYAKTPEPPPATLGHAPMA
ncbi:hypothetical protein SPRG_12200 [Saprolegnia parasitica CBS 223.65]|uniref:Uncharacterized protein n=1 Tax=Saprolegnia parasitica (strain CBS 223.65) TaxID=695850 RepID=A0A067BWY9_SAPPC|nr:hypothetical protein SPRG_12200 [Saprolegnia parasitica CBS 223.65]KDO22773.1 hypothetical protein SPRG_12200 [Saprolegnia parasitica CBS 223.65]|eukprot:XP_012206557.1 hypothetical protein SPRG_12200 [Saprolegnia parasitica CBS 223.65]